MFGSKKEKEFETFQQQALPVRQPDSNFDEKTFVPKDGAEYLMKVVQERKKCPAIVAVNFPKQKNSNLIFAELTNPLNYTNEINDISLPILRPSVEWKEAQVNDFQETRDKILRFRRKLAAKGYTPDISLPLIDDIEGWNEYCRSNEPYLRIMLTINQRSLEKLLEFETEWIKNAIDGKPINLSGEDIWLGKWIYSTMACLRMPLEAQVHSTLRDIVRSCITLRNKLQSSDGSKVDPYNLFIYIIAKYFHQFDLIDFV